MSSKCLAAKRLRRFCRRTGPDRQSRKRPATGRFTASAGRPSVRSTAAKGVGKGSGERREEPPAGRLHPEFSGNALSAFPTVVHSWNPMLELQRNMAKAQAATVHVTYKNVGNRGVGYKTVDARRPDH
jgi:hypothetical protein